VVLQGVVTDLNGKPQFDTRTINLQRGADGRGYTLDEDESSFSNVPLCPNPWSSRDIFNQDYELIVRLQDSRGKKLQKILTIRPACNVPGQEAGCLCLCKQGYKSTDSCPTP
jgi:hypothetical protein